MRPRYRRALKEPNQTKRALTVVQLRRVVGVLTSERPIDIRNRALVAFGFASALRRSELAALDVRDLLITEGRGLVLTVRSSKTDQIARGGVIGIPYGSHAPTSPVPAMKRWIESRGEWLGPLFVRFQGQDMTHEQIHPNLVSRVLKRKSAPA